VNADVDGGAVHLLARDSLDVDDPLAAIDLHHLALAALVGSPHHLHLIVLPNRNGTHIVFRPEIGGERRAHKHAADARRRREMRLAALAPARGNPRIELHSLSLLSSFCDGNANERKRVYNKKIDLGFLLSSLIIKI